MVTVRRGRAGAEFGELLGRAGGGGLAGVGDGGVQRDGRVEFGDGELPELLLQIASAELALWH